MLSTCDYLHTAEAPIHLTGSPWSPVRVGGQRATLWHLSDGSRSLQGLQALSPRRWPPPGAFIKLPALRVVHDLLPRSSASPAPTCRRRTLLRPEHS